jgi:hypothetical protein
MIVRAQDGNAGLIGGQEALGSQHAVNSMLESTWTEHAVIGAPARAKNARGPIQNFIFSLALLMPPPSKRDMT